MYFPIFIAVIVFISLVFARPLKEAVNYIQVPVQRARQQRANDVGHNFRWDHAVTHFHDGRCVRTKQGGVGANIFYIEQSSLLVVISGAHRENNNSRCLLRKLIVLMLPIAGVIALSPFRLPVKIV